MFEMNDTVKLFMEKHSSEKIEEIAIWAQDMADWIKIMAYEKRKMEQGDCEEDFAKR